MIRTKRKSPMKRKSVGGDSKIPKRKRKSERGNNDEVVRSEERISDKLNDEEPEQEEQPEHDDLDGEDIEQSEAEEDQAGHIGDGGDPAELGSSGSENREQVDDDDSDGDQGETETIRDNEQEDTIDQEEPEFLGSKKKHTPGIIYLSYIPEGLTVAKCREIFQDFGNVGRIFFEPVKSLTKKTRPNHRFVEGWVEFERKKVAKEVAAALNSKPIGGKRRTPYHDALWSLKYLHRFRWTHLSERLAYEKAVKDQRLRTEIAQAKREASYYAKALERSIRMKKQRKFEAQAETKTDDGKKRGDPKIKLRKTDKEIRQEKNIKSQIDKTLLSSIFAK